MLPAKLESVQSEVTRPEAALKVAQHQLSPAPSAATATKAKLGRHLALIEDGAQNLQDLEVFFGKLLSFIFNHSSLIRSSQGMLHYYVHCTSNTYFQPIFDAVANIRIHFTLRYRVKKRCMTTCYVKRFFNFPLPRSSFIKFYCCE